MNEFDLASKVYELLKQHKDVFKDEVTQQKINYSINVHDEYSTELLLNDYSMNFNILRKIDKILYIKYIDIDKENNRFALLVELKKDE